MFSCAAIPDSLFAYDILLHICLTVSSDSGTREEYEGTRHNTGRAILSAFQKKKSFEWERDKKLNALISEGKVGKEKYFILPETFMNLSERQ